jgi:hypothetical protein
MPPSSVRKRKKESERRTKQNAGYTFKKKNYPQSEFLERRVPLSGMVLFSGKKERKIKSIVPTTSIYSFWQLPAKPKK